MTDMLFQKPTRFADLTPHSAVFLITILIIIIVYGLIVYQSLIANAQNGITKGEDLRCQRRIVERIHAGEGYYKAAGDELRSRGYATSSVFNWRLPLLAWLLGHLPDTNTGKVLAVILASITLLIWITVLLQNQYSFSQSTLGSLVLLGPMIYSLTTDIFLIHEFWAGTCITLSLAAYARGWRGVSMISGLVGLFLRELTLPFVCIMLVLSYIEGRRREALVWLMGIIAFGLELLFHGLIVKNLIMEGDLALKYEWIVFGGWRFVLSTAQMHIWLLLAPTSVTAIILPLALIGLAGWRGQLGLRVSLSVGIYVLAYLFVGRPVNQMWGLMYTNVMLLGLLITPHSLKDLCQSTRNKLKEA